MECQYLACGMGSVEMGLTLGPINIKFNARHQRQGQSWHGFANQRIIITDFLARPSQQLNINKLVASSCSLSFSNHHHFPALLSFLLRVVHFSFPWIQTAQSSTLTPVLHSFHLKTMYYLAMKSRKMKQAKMLKNKTAELNNLAGNRDWIVEGQTSPLSWSPSDVQREIPPHRNTLWAHLNYHSSDCKSAGC